MQLGHEFIKALQELTEERNLSEDVIVSSIEAALANAYRKYRIGNIDPEVHIDRENGEIEIFDIKKVVEEPHPQTSEISIEEARSLGFANALIGSMVRIPVNETPDHFGRIAAQTARQVIIQRLKDAEREIVFNQFAEKIGDLVTGIIFKSENDQVIVRINERNEAILPKEERIAGELYVPGERKKFFLLDVRPTTRGPRIIVSRTHPGLLRRLMELEIPEIADGTIEIKGIVREAGTRAKIAVASSDPGVDPVGACVGNSGTRIKSISNDLNGEKIDIIVWSEDPLIFIKNALSPAKPLKIEPVLEQERTVKVFAKPDQLSLAIGKAGQNVRLAARLTGWKLDINTVADEKDKLSDLFDGKEE